MSDLSSLPPPVVGLDEKMWILYHIIFYLGKYLLSLLGSTCTTYHDILSTHHTAAVSNTTAECRMLWWSRNSCTSCCVLSAAVIAMWSASDTQCALPFIPPLWPGRGLTVSTHLPGDGSIGLQLQLISSQPSYSPDNLPAASSQPAPARWHFLSSVTYNHFSCVSWSGLYCHDE